MKLFSYIILSFFAEACMIYYAYYTQRQFYPTVLFLVSSKLSIVLAGNLCLAVTMIAAKVVQYSFFGSLRTIEAELLVEKAKYAFIETCLALTIFRQELTGPVLALFGFLIFIKLLHKLAKMRQEYLEQIADVSLYMQLRIGGLLGTLLLVDALVVAYAIQNFLTKGRSVLMLFGFEFGLLVNYALNLLIKFTIQCIDSRMENGLQMRGFLVMIVDLFCEVVKVITYVVFFALIFSYYGLPIHLVRDVYAAYHSFHRKLMGFIKYWQVTRNLEHRFPDATEAECLSAGNCLVCREEMLRAKKLPCNHCFHIDCLRMWMQHQQSCPLCRADIVVPADDNAAVAAAIPAAVAPAAAAVPANAAHNNPVPANVNNIPNPIVNNNNNPVVPAAGIPAAAPANNINQNIHNLVQAATQQPATINNTATNGTIVPQQHLRPPQQLMTGAILKQAAFSSHNNTTSNTIYGNNTALSNGEFPAYYIVSSLTPLQVYPAPSTSNSNNTSSSSSSGTQTVGARTVSLGAIIFVTGRLLSATVNNSNSSYDNASSVSWLRMSDGWIMEIDPVTNSVNVVPLMPPNNHASTKHNNVVRQKTAKSKKESSSKTQQQQLFSLQQQLLLLQGQYEDDNEEEEEEDEVGGFAGIQSTNTFAEKSKESTKKNDVASTQEIAKLQRQMLHMTQSMEAMHITLLACQRSLSRLVHNKIVEQAEENLVLLQKADEKEVAALSIALASREGLKEAATAALPSVSATTAEKVEAKRVESESC